MVGTHCLAYYPISFCYLISGDRLNFVSQFDPSCILGWWFEIVIKEGFYENQPLLPQYFFTVSMVGFSNLSKSQAEEMPKKPASGE
jgi:hypothetical protein